MGGRSPATVGVIGGGNATTRLSGTEVDREHRAKVAEAAAMYLVRTGNVDLLPVLGLDGGEHLACRGCGKPFAVRHPRQRQCQRGCVPGSRKAGMA